MDEDPLSASRKTWARPNIRLKTQQRLLREMLQKTRMDVSGGDTGTGAGYFVLVLDNRTAKILGNVLKMSELMEIGQVVMVENILKKRQPLPELPALYFLDHHTEGSIEKLIEDYPGDNNSMYSAAYVFWSSPISDAVMEKLKKNRHLLSKLKSFTEINVDFCPFDAFTFLVDVDHLLPALERTKPHAAIKQNFEDLNVVSHRLGTACISLNEMPVIRYSRKSAAAEFVAKEVQKMFDLTEGFNDTKRREAGEDSGFWYWGDGNDGHGPARRRASLIILDRTDDLLAPLLHEFTYESMLFDLDEPEHGDHKVYKAGSGAEKKIWLDSSSTIWGKMRHKHISSVATELDGMLRKAAASKSSSVLRKDFERMDMDELRKVMINAPEWSEMAAQVQGHISFVLRLMELYGNDGAEEASSLEQIIITGVDDDGRRISSKTVEELLHGFLQNEKVSSTRKIRVVCIHSLCAGGLSNGDLEKLVAISKPSFSDQDLKALHGLGSFASDIGPQVLNKNELKSAIKEARANDYTTRKRDPILKTVVSELIAGKLNEDTFPYVKEPPADFRNWISKEPPQSVRLRPCRDELEIEDSEESEEYTHSSGRGSLCPRVIVFIIGGMTKSESCAMYDLMAEVNREIVLGSNSIITPSKFLDELGKISAKPKSNRANRLDLMKASA